jgi:diguanylate cyclase (GGDEF)-like protein
MSMRVATHRPAFDLAKAIVSKAVLPATPATRWLFGYAGVLLTVTPVWLVIGVGGERGVEAFSDLAQIAAAGYASVSCLRAGRRFSGTRRKGWLLVGAGAGSWGSGAVVWAWYELVRGDTVPYPSLADVGYLGMVPLVLAGMAVLTTVRRGGVRGLLDCLIIASSVLYISWATVLGAVYQVGGESSLAFGVSLAYPFGDVAMVSMVLVLLGNTDRGHRAALGMLGTGAAGFAVADSGFAYLTATGQYGSGNMIDLGWVAGLVLIGLAGAMAADRPGPDQPDPVRVPSMLTAGLPYLPVSVAVVVSTVTEFRHGTLPPMLYLLDTLMVMLVLARQLAIVRVNLTLIRQAAETVVELERRDEELRALAFRDSLTGLANRALFADRADHALARQDREGTELAVLYVDLDGFKAVNDRLGHEIGDAVLVQAAIRLQAQVRGADTLARLGGDEFAVLCEAMSATQAVEVAQRLIEAMEQPIELNGTVARIGASVGVSTRMPSGVPISELLRRADVAMYAAKAGGKGRHVLFEPRVSGRRLEGSLRPA